MAKKRRKQRKRTSANVPNKARLKAFADQLWSVAVRSDWDHRCAVCGHRKCQAHHLVPRQHQATRYDLQNGIALCASCHNYNKDISPHQNAAGWVGWLETNHPKILEWYVLNRYPSFAGTTNVLYYINVITGLREYVDESEFDRIVGTKFSAWLQEEEATI